VSSFSQSSYRIQPTTGISRRLLPDWISRYSLGLLPFSAIIGTTRRTDFPQSAAPRPQVFATSRQVRRDHRSTGLFHPASTPRVLTSRAWHRNDYLSVIRAICSFAVILLSWFPSEPRPTFPLSPAAEDYPFLRPCRGTAPCLLAKTGSHLRIEPTLKPCSRFDASPLDRQFHPMVTMITLLAFCSFRACFRQPWSPSPFWDTNPYRVLLLSA
jgi:hypothetical protein